MKFTGESQADYLNLRHDNCGGFIKVEFLGYDPAVPRFDFRCQKCGEHGSYKMQFPLWSGLPQEAHKP